MTKIITTIGPASNNAEMLKYFVEHKVKIARLNFSHNNAEGHIESGNLARAAGAELMVDLAGPKVLMGNFDTVIEIEAGQEVVFEKEIEAKYYPVKEVYTDKSYIVLPTLFDLSKYLKKDSTILVDDGKVIFKVLEVKAEKVFATATNRGHIKQRKGINLPGCDLNIDFLVQRDRELLTEVLPVLKPEWIAPSFVKTITDIKILKKFIQAIIIENGIENYTPKYCTKIEMSEAVEKNSLEELIKESDMIMIARGDLALETWPLHVNVPRLQEEIAEKCKKKNKPFIVATQILESMMDSPVPTRAEISDLYRAVHTNKADYVMLSGESAAGKFPKEAVKIMSEMIDLSS